MFVDALIPHVYAELDRIWTALSDIPEVKTVTYEDKQTWLNFDELKVACQSNQSILVKYFISSVQSELFTLCVDFKWRGFEHSLRALYPDTTTVLEFRSFAVLAGYCFELSNEQSVALLRIDSSPHHQREVPESFPHHRHELVKHRFSKKRADPGPFHPRYDTLKSLLRSYIS
jgi:hypothetical protein